MASFIPIIQEILPMLMPSSISVTRASEIFPPAPPPAEGSPRDTSGGVRVVSRDAVVNKTDKMCVTGMSPPTRQLTSPLLVFDQQRLKLGT